MLKQQKHQELINILLSNHRYHTSPITLQNFLIDMIIVVDITVQPLLIMKKQAKPLNLLRKKISPSIYEAYKRAIEEIEKTTPQENQIITYLNNVGGFQKQQFQSEGESFDLANLVLRETYEATPVKNLFTLNLNVIIYTLQKECGFYVQKVILNDKIFLLLHCQQQNLTKAAVIHKIKKEVIYSEVDIYLNEPLDSKNRPILLNRRFRSKNYYNRTNDEQTQERLTYKNNVNRRQLKKYHRKLGNVRNYTNQIIDQVQLSKGEISKFQKFFNEYKQLLEPLDNSPLEQILTNNQIDYIEKVLDQDAENQKGAVRIFKEIKRKQIYFAQLIELVKKYDYRVFQPSAIYTSFFELNKKKKYVDRIRSLFMFKPLLVGPEGQLQLFLRSERTRLSYLILQQHFRIQNFPQYGLQFLTLHNSFQKSGKSQIQTNVKGGLDGKNLQSSWSVFKPWKSDIKVIRDYLGQSIAYFTFLKNRLILDLMIFAPIAFVAFMIIILVLPLNLTLNSHLDSFIFYTTFAFVVLIWFSAYTIRQDQEQAFHFGSLRQTSFKRTPNYGYKSPYVRNLITDSPNQFRQVKSIFNRVKEFLGLVFVIVLLCLDVGIFYGVRSWSLALQAQIPNSNLFFQWYTFIPMFLFFLGNHLVYIFVLKRLFKYITSLENNPNLQKDESSTQVKCLLFQIGLELIGPIDLMVVEALGSNHCYDSSCWNAYEGFISIRFIVVFILLLIRLMTFVVEIIINKIKLKKESERELKQDLGEQQSKIKKLFIKIIQQYGKKEHKVDVQEQLLILVQLALFSVIQPINILINLLTILLEFYLQRVQILHGARRPINMATSTPDYSFLMRIPFYIFCSFNSWMLLVNFQDLEYVSPQFYLTFLTNPTKDGIITLKIVFALCLFCFMLLFEFIFRKIYLTYSSYSQLIKRKQKKLTQYLHQYRRAKVGASENNHFPIVHIGRIKF